jgi:DNA-binding transcriptional MerR regulator
MPVRLQWHVGGQVDRRVMEPVDDRNRGPLRIGELARATGHSAKTLRYYEEVGLLRSQARTPAGYRTYGADAIERLRLIRNAQDLGFSLEDARRILDAGDAGNDPCVHTLALVDRELEQLALQATRLRALRKDLLALRQRVSDGLGKAAPHGGVCSCLTEGFSAKTPANRSGAKRRNLRKEDRRGLPVP